MLTQLEAAVRVRWPEVEAISENERVQLGDVIQGLGATRSIKMIESL